MRWITAYERPGGNVVSRNDDFGGWGSPGNGDRSEGAYCTHVRRRDLWGRWARRWGWSVAGIVLTALGQLVLWTVPGSDVHPPDFLGSALVCAVGLPLLIGQRRPLPALGVSTVSLLAYDALGYPPSPTALGFLALITLTVGTRPRRTSWSIVGALTVTVFVVDAIRPGPHALANALVNSLWVPIAALAGIAVRYEQARAQLVRREQDLLVERLRLEADQASAVERLRIARELHDAVGHGITLASLRAEAAACLLRRDPDRATELLHDVGRHARDALAELHQLVGLLRDGAEPPPGPAGDLDKFVGRFVGPDFDVRLETGRHCGDLPARVNEAVSAIVAEGLTNVVRHAGAHHALVRITSAAGEVVVEISDDGHGPNPGTRPGFGLAGAGERARALGGYVDFGAGPGGGSLLRAVLPCPELASA